MNNTTSTRSGLLSPASAPCTRPRKWRTLKALAAASLLALLVVQPPAAADALPDTIERVKPSVVSIATHQPARSPRAHYLATGFAVGDGSLIVTNHHVIPTSLDHENREQLVVVSGEGRDTSIHSAELVAHSADDDLALLRIAGPPLPPLQLGSSDAVREGEQLAFTGFPIGMVLGTYPATHRASVAARTPMAITARRSSELSEARIRQLRAGAPMVFQLDATAYPGNSGSPVYRIDSGEVVGVINQVFVQGGREAAVGHPSGISYAVPADRIRPLLANARE
ncbi:MULTISPECIES: S1C family serine protease [unclassified Thioalkalivibrio]|uniref:S1C family serine protease n=1 Tax=unclassified Thioalkalivibrio TaxID=2621013 RepID=UPI0003A813C8|nr:MULTISPECIES: serine protease [unclassified Thioalkalivibrio]